MTTNPEQRADDSFDVETLPPVRYLIMETLAARRRLGHPTWTLPAKVGVSNLDALAALGLIGWKRGVIQGYVLAWLTDDGERACFDPAYIAPLAAILEG